MVQFSRIWASERIWRLTLHEKLLANLAELLHGGFGQILVAESTFKPFINIGVLGEPRRPWPRWLLALRHVVDRRNEKLERALL